MSVKTPTSLTEVDLLGPVDWYRSIRDQIQHEDNLIIQRLSWLMAAQSFLFTGFAITVNGGIQARNAMLARQQDLLVNIIPAVACVSDILIYCSVLAGILALYRLRKTYKKHIAAIGDFPEIQGTRLTRWLGIASPILLPLVFLLAWLIVWSQANP